MQLDAAVQHMETEAKNLSTMAFLEEHAIIDVIPLPPKRKPSSVAEPVGAAANTSMEA
jgi:hypothetical protein